MARLGTVLDAPFRAVCILTRHGPTEMFIVAATKPWLGATVYLNGQPAFDRACFVKDLCTLADMNIPFLHQGYSLEGMDCVNLLRYAYELQKPLPGQLTREFDAYDERPDGRYLMKVMRRWFSEVPITKVMPADVLVFYARKNSQHVAGLVGENDIVEAYRSDDGHIKRVLRQPLDPRRRLAAAFRIPDFA